MINTKGEVMASITIRNLDDSVKAQLRLVAAQHGCSMEEEARKILRMGLVKGDNNKISLGSKIQQRFADIAVEALPSRDRNEPPRSVDF